MTIRIACLTLTVLLGVSFGQEVSAASVDDPKCEKWNNEVIPLYKQALMIRKNSKDWKEVQIDTSAWRTLDFDTKQAFVVNTAKCLSNGTITLRDFMSGKILATRTLLGGVKIEG